MTFNFYFTLLCVYMIQRCNPHPPSPYMVSCPILAPCALATVSYSIELCVDNKHMIEDVHALIRAIPFGGVGTRDHKNRCDLCREGII